MKKTLVITFISALLAGACKKETTDFAKGAVNGPIEELQVPAQFNFKTSRDLGATVQVNGLDDAPLQGIRIDFYDQDPQHGGKKFAAGYTDQSGRMSTLIKVPAYLREVFVQCQYQGFANSATVSAAQSISLNFGGKPAPRALKKAAMTTPIPAGGNVYYMGTYNNSGVPSYLENPGDPISQALLDDINASLPERNPVPTANPSYLTPGNNLDVVVTELSEVWVTFVSEGAGYKNALAYYVFDSNNPPASAAQIDSVFLVFPNASLSGSGGDLNAGDKVKLGIFPAGKTISWVLFQNAWDSNSQTVKVNNAKVYSNPAFNPGSGTQRQHTVQLSDPARQILLNGVEDIYRNSGGSDQDFNDCIFYVSANPFRGIDNGSTPPLTNSGDSDGDGVDDPQDEYPNDPARTADIDYQGALGFEDLWPAQGDYDFNDLAVDYKITHVINAQNQVVDVKADWTIKAVGAAFNNGFGWQFASLPSTSVSTVSGSSITTGLVSLNGNGTEAGQNTATVIAWDQTFSEIQHAGGPFINTIKADPYVQPVTKSMTLSFVNPVQTSALGLPPYNPFIFVDGDRGREVHLSNGKPTALATSNLLGSVDDDSDPGQERFYRTENNLPWAIHVYGTYQYPIEYSPINEAYLKFSQWATSGGTSFEDWYLDLSGYRDASKIY